ncbi:MAG: tRNA 2-selenouridine(34) synthase MnmH [Bacteroidetes bacterium]|nr:tRNA 2-selenouridine(34) synthase MnmH [Bacteroidota bacterium]HET6245933.1 tRNA 2-selenouridine(34) synthase MnmH [Bacteroidia bacterium]
MPSILNIQEFLKLSETMTVLDVRTPAEFEQGHIPGAFNLPLFKDEERKIVGTIYKQQGKQAAILKGLELVGPRLKDIIEAANKINADSSFLVHCWRGGMRSSSIAWLLEAYGHKTLVLKGGYKSFRKLAFQIFTEPQKLLVLGGRTGAAKTLLLYKLQNKGQQIIDLEKLSNHKGSSFGSLGENKQPSQEAFENELAMAFYSLDKDKTIWLEDESRMIGQKVIPAAIWEQMRLANVVYLDIPFVERVAYLVSEYGKFKSHELIESTNRISKRLGGQHAKRAVEAIKQGDLKTACEITLAYYDKAYDFGIEKREPEKVIKFSFDKLDTEKIAAEIIKSITQVK